MYRFTTDKSKEKFKYHNLFAGIFLILCMINNSSILSIIIPYRNRAQYIGSLLHSLKEQKRVETKVDIIFVDNGSSDSSHEIVDKWIVSEASDWMSIKHITENKTGASIARNRGIENSESEWVMFFDSDDLMPETHIYSVLKSIQERPNVDLIYWRAIFNDEHGRKKIKHGKRQSRDIDVVIHSVWATQRYAVKRNFLLSAGPWNDSLKVWDDWELAVRLLINNPLSYYEKKITPVVVNIHRDSITGIGFSHSIGQWESALSEARKQAEHFQRPDILKFLSFKESVLAANYKREKNFSASIKLINDLKERKRFGLRNRLAYYWQCIIGKGSSIFLYF